MFILNQRPKKTFDGESILGGMQNRLCKMRSGMKMIRGCKIFFECCIALPAAFLRTRGLRFVVSDIRNQAGDQTGGFFRISLPVLASILSELGFPGVRTGNLVRKQSTTKTFLYRLMSLRARNRFLSNLSEDPKSR